MLKADPGTAKALEAAGIELAGRYIGDRSNPWINPEGEWCILLDLDDLGGWSDRDQEVLAKVARVVGCALNELVWRGGVCADDECQCGTGSLFIYEPGGMPS